MPHPAITEAPDTLDLTQIKAYRLALRIDQKAFWSPLGVTQSGGSRYEGSGPSRAIPKPVAILLLLIHKGLVTGQHLDIISKELNEYEAFRTQRKKKMARASKKASVRWP